MAAVVTSATLVLTLTTVASLAAAAGDGLARGWHQGEEEGGSAVSGKGIRTCVLSLSSSL